MRLLKIICLASCLAPAAGQAQTPPAENLAAARELVVVMRSADQFKALMPMMMQSLRPAMVQGRSPQFERDYDAVVKIILDGMGARFTEVSDQFADIYAQSFTAAELRELIAFYRGPTGQKLLEKTPSIALQSMEAGQRFGAKLVDDLKGRIFEELRKRGHNI